MLLWPIAIEQALSSLVGLSDTVMVSNVGDYAVSAVGLIDTVSVLLINVFAAVATGATVVIAQMYGRGDKRGIGRTIGQSAIAVTLIMFAVTLCAQIFRTAVFDALYPGVDANVRAAGLGYFGIISFNYPIIGLYSVLTGSLRGQGDTRTPMIVSAIINAVNIALNALFIFGLGMGVQGAALATICGWSVGVAIMLVITLKRNGAGVFSPKNLIPSKDILGRVFAIGIPAGLDALMFHSGKIIVQTFLAGMGTANISGNVIAGSMFGFVCIPGNAFAIAATTLVGQSYGAGRRREAKRNMLVSIGTASAMLAAVSLVLYGLAGIMVGFYNPTPEAEAVAVKILRLYLIMIPLCWPTSFVSASGLRAVNDVTYVMVFSMISMWVMRVACAWLLGVKLGMGPLGINIAMGLDWVIRSVFYMPRILTLKRLKTDIQPEPVPAEV